MKKQMFLYLFGVFVMEPSFSTTFSLPSQGDTVGERQTVTMKKGNTLIQMAQQYDIGVAEITRANPKIKLYSRYQKNIPIHIPAVHALPSGPREGLVLNLAEKRIYYYHPKEQLVSTYPVGIGKQGWSTPQGMTEIKAKEKNPAWRPPPSIQREAARRGRNLPKVVPPGKHNPLGRFAMRLGLSGILIHGTNQPGSIGLRCSHGCIRMYPKNIEQLFELISVGTPVRIVNEPKT